MGMTEVTLQIKSLANPKKKVIGSFLVDSGAFYTLLPQTMVKQLKVRPDHEQEFSLADGTAIKRKIGSAFIKFQDREIASPVILGEKNDTALMGTLTLEAFGLILDPFERKLHSARLTL